ncbi:5-(carboxyamino)imidazole ribonucleotide synthase [Sphingomicrobium astaxanthinifaciens]|uniref:5-(carboxyamino)imidazole ribonucleotide synthase n=1 Tax=Sphingomicrobium astaxanthinifaciens TaxID=1227949 RepID=UPI001FCB17F7|nr:5-(carboxyamino)imidazole ribonucleotide synthase [Sphingomicrobium astaxanthinifaciens]MCJ7420988.1 5-(carboxyamino)imidazole ribonucleotide synthase [Sphingomicrobium astaxanthinifaciens]
MSLPPGSTIGIVGGGQLGRMLCLAAHRMGYRTHVYAPDPAPPASGPASLYVCADYANRDALAAFAAECDVITYEFENLPVAALEAMGDKLHPGTRSLAIAQDRAAEKRFIEEHGGTVANWRPVSEPGDLEGLGEEIGFPLVLKSRRLGYDGKGQAWVREESQLPDAWEAIGREPAVAEAAVDFTAEFSILVARRADDALAVWNAPRNIHDGGILRRSEVPAGEGVDEHVERAVEIACALAGALGHVGVMAVEFFATAEGPIVNEIAPRVHNSGHWTIEGSQTSQFEQHLRCIAGLPLGDPALVAPRVTMDNLIGSDVERWEELLAEPGAHLHVYGKKEARPGRKMGHVTRLG